MWLEAHEGVQSIDAARHQLDTLHTLPPDLECLAKLATDTAIMFREAVERVWMGELIDRPIRRPPDLEGLEQLAIDAAVMYRKAVVRAFQNAPEVVQ